MSFIRGPNPIWFMNNLTGAPLDDTYYAFFLTNDLPYVPQAVYQDPDGLIPWSDPIEFQPSAGLPNNLYFDPTLVYRIEIRQGPDQTYPLIWLIENYTLSSEAESGGVIALTTTSNIITNPQFADIDFVSPLVITTAGTYDIAPGWQLVLTGTGTTTVTQVANSGDSNIEGNPPYYITFANSGWSTAQLIQTFTNNGAIFAGGAIAVSFLAAATGTPVQLSVIYTPSNLPGNSTTIFPISGPGTITVGALTEYSAAVDIPASTNTDSGPAANVQIIFVLPVNGTISLTNIQITGQSQPLPSGYLQTMNPLFQEIPYERVVDQEFHIYKDSLLTEPKDNLLVGWTFALNPWQYATITSTNIPVNQYTADQTIIIQQNYVATGTGNNVAVGQGTAAQNHAYVVTAVTATNQFAIVQYIDPRTIGTYWGQILSAMVNTAISTSNSTTVKFKVRLIWSTALPLTVSRTEPILSWTAGADPTFSSAWTPIVPLNDPAYTLVNGTNTNFAFDQFQLPESTSVNMTLGIVLYTTGSMSITSPADSILFNRVSLVPNDYAIDASTETYDETLRKCQYYYEKSYQVGALPGTASYVGSNAIVTSLGAFAFLYSFYIRYQQYKRNNPLVTLYSPRTGAANTISVGIRINGSYATGITTNPADVAASNLLITTYESQNGSQAVSQNTTTVFASSETSGEVVNEYQYTADARMGM